MKYYFPSDPDYNLWYSIRRTHQSIYNIRKRVISLYKLSTIESGVLFIIHESKNNITPAEISRQLLQAPNQISQLLTRMEKKGLLYKQKGTPKKNVVQVRLTKKGEDAFKLSTTDNKLSKIMSALSKREKRQLLKYLDKLQQRAMEEFGGMTNNVIVTV